MADYKELLRKAVEALPENNGAARRAVYEKALDATPVQVTTFQKLAALLIETNELAAAQTVLTRGLENFPDHPKLREWRAFLLMGEEKYPEAHALFKALEPARRREVQVITDPALREREQKRLASFYLQYALAANRDTGGMDVGFHRHHGWPTGGSTISRAPPVSRFSA